MIPHTRLESYSTMDLELYYGALALGVVVSVGVPVCIALGLAFLLSRH